MPHKSGARGRLTFTYNSGSGSCVDSRWFSENGSIAIALTKTRFLIVRMSFAYSLSRT
ncbi:hypothetical protein BC2230_30029 [Burkholderia cepacia]